MFSSRVVPWVVAALLLSGCSRRREHVAPEAPVISAAARRVEAPEPIQEEPDETPQTEQYEVKSPDGDLVVSVVVPLGTGTSHHAERVTVKHGKHTIELVSSFEGGEGTMAPLIEEVLPLGRDRFLLLGWSSHGAGQQANHALLLKASEGEMVILDELVSGTQRAHAALLARTSAPPAIGVPQEAVDVDGDGDRWSFTTKHAELDRHQFGRLKARPSAAEAPGVVRYTPPFHERETHERRVVWFEVGERRFVVPEVLVDAGEHAKQALGMESALDPQDDVRVDLDGDGLIDEARCVKDGCLAPPCSSYLLYVKRPGGSLFVGDTPVGPLKLSGQRHNGFHVLDMLGAGRARMRFERGRYRVFERCEGGNFDRPCRWESVAR